MTSYPTGPSMVRHSAGLHVFLWTVLPGIGALVGWLLSRVPGWLAQVSWLPQHELMERLADDIGLKTTIVLIVLGVVAGGVLALMSYDDIVEVAVDRDAVAITRARDTKRFARAQAAGAFVDGKDLVLLGVDGGEVAREKTDHAAATLRSAFQSQGYRWHDADPHAGEFARWFDGMPGLSPHANAILRTRQAALDSDDTADSRELRAELAKLGVVVRDDRKRQYWRQVPGGTQD